MKIYIPQIFLLFLMYSCVSKQATEKLYNEANSVMNSSNVFSISTAYVYPNIELPPHFYIDSISVYDTKTRAFYEAFFLQSNMEGMKMFNQASLQAVKNQIEIEQLFVEPFKEKSPVSIIYSFKLKPVELYSNNNIISIYNIIDTYSNGGNHHNYTNYSFNYDIRTNKPIDFNDIFNVQSKTDSTNFIEFAEEYTIENGCTAWEWPNEHLDFSITDTGIFINPNLSWACVSTRSLIPIDSTNKFIRNEWVQLKLQTK